MSTTTLESIMLLADQYAQAHASLMCATGDEDSAGERDALAAAIQRLLDTATAHQEAVDLAVHRGYADVIEAIDAAGIKPKPLDPEVDGVLATEVIPPITEPMGRSWRQPPRENIRITGELAIMSQSTFKQLPEYSSSYPSGVYNGKMWRRFGSGDLWWLVWYESSEDPNKCKISSRTIVIHPKVTPS